MVLLTPGHSAVPGAAQRRGQRDLPRPARPRHRVEGGAGVGLAQDPGVGFLPSWAAVLGTTEHPLTWPGLQLPAVGEFAREKKINQLKPKHETIICPLPNLIWET